MGENSNIEWTDHTFNPWVGCTKVTEGCTNCYAEAQFGVRFGVEWGQKGERKKTKPANWNKPITWNRKAGEAGQRQRVFCASLADVFDDHPSIQQAWRNELWELIDATPNLEWLLLTKRPENFRQYLTAHNKPKDNVRLGVTAEHKKAADLRLPFLAREAFVGWKTFVSYEPAMGPVNWDLWLNPEGIAGGTIGWVVAGGESGPKARAPHPDWFTSCRDNCEQAGIPFLFKQWGEWVPMMGHAEGVPVGKDKFTHPDGTIMGLAGKKASGRLLDGQEHINFPIF